MIMQARTETIPLEAAVLESVALGVRLTAITAAITRCEDPCIRLKGKNTALKLRTRLDVLASIIRG